MICYKVYIVDIATSGDTSVEEPNKINYIIPGSYSFRGIIVKTCYHFCMDEAPSLPI